MLIFKLKLNYILLQVATITRALLWGLLQIFKNIHMQKE